MLRFGGAGVTVLMDMTFAQTSEPAGGAALGDLVYASAAATVLTIGLLALASGHRSGRIKWLGRLADFAADVSGLPRWCALPSAVAGGALILAMFGFFWDVSVHIDNGRDSGPFGTPAHYAILAGIGGIALGGALTIILGGAKKSPSSIKLGPGWHVPVGGVLIFAGGALAALGFPLDDVWHRLFGQDVTLWGPTHVLMVASAALSTLAIWILLTEGRRAMPEPPPGEQKKDLGTRLNSLRGPSIAGGFLIGMSALQTEFDFGVPQFHLVFQPIMLMLGAACALVAARIVLGPGGALKAVAFYLVMRVAATVLVGPVLGESTQHFPLYVAEAGLVELAALWLGSERSLRLGLVAGGLIGTVGLAAEWGWSHVWMPIPWSSSMLADAIVLGGAAALAGGVLGAFIGGALRGRAPAGPIGPGWAAGAAALTLLVVIAWPMAKTDGSSTTATVTLRTLESGPERTVEMTARLDPPDAADDAEWIDVIAWQGGGLVLNRPKEIAPGVFRSTEPIPVHGEWKAGLRIAKGRSLQTLPLYMPADPAIPAAEVPAEAQFTRAVLPDKEFLQRESRDGVSWVRLPAYLVLAGLMAALLLGLAWALRRVHTAGAPLRRPRPGRRTAALPA